MSSDVLTLAGDRSKRVPMAVFSLVNGDEPADVLGVECLLATSLSNGDSRSNPSLEVSVGNVDSVSGMKSFNCFLFLSKPPTAGPAEIAGCKAGQNCFESRSEKTPTGC